jgi:uncharacterized protein
MPAPEFIPIDPDATLRFACHRDVACFNQCCRDLNQALTPYDVVRLKNHLGLTSRAFIATYAAIHTGPATGLPVVALRFENGPEKQCPFVTPGGCRVYAARPSSCRTYPLARALRRARSDGRISEHFAVIRESHCRGFEQPATQTVRQWLVDQELAAYHTANDALMDLIALKNQVRPGALAREDRQMVRMALYDIERLRQKALDRALPAMDGDDLNPLPADDRDEAWLLWGLQWITRALFGSHGRCTGDPSQGMARCS